MNEVTTTQTQVTEVQIIPVKPTNGLIAFASCVIDGKLLLSSIGVFTKLDGSGYRITFPTKKVGREGFNVNVFNPINKEACEAITRAILAKVGNLFEI